MIMKKSIVFLLIVTIILLVAACDMVNLSGGGNGNGGGESSMVKWAGIRVSKYGMEDAYGDGNFPNVTKMSNLVGKMTSYYPGSTGTYLLIVGTMSGDDTCQLWFPKPSGTSKPDYVEFTKSDKYEEYLTEFDKKGYSVWLQVEPGYADLETLVKLVLDRYGHHTCVKGFGIDVEWHKPVEGSDRGTALNDTTAKKVLAAVRKYNKDYTVFVKHWMSSYLPSKMDGLIYVNDSQQFKSLADYQKQFSQWAKRYAPQPVMFQIGYRADRGIWGELENPAKDLGTYIAESCDSGNDVGIIWVDFTLNQVL